MNLKDVLHGALTNIDIIDYGTFTTPQTSNDIITTVVPFDHDVGKTYFINSSFKNAFFKLAPHYIPQQHITTCGIASAIIVLNTIYRNKQLKKPLDQNGSLYIDETNKLYAHFIWNENNFFNENVKKILDRKIITGKKKINNTFSLGVSLDNLTKAISLHGVAAKCHHVTEASKINIGKFRCLIKDIMLNPKKFMIANYHLSIQLPELDSGHFSPIAAYDEGSDCLLVLDTWSSFTPWVWINLVEFYKSMNTLDNGSYRGFIIVE